MSGQQRTPGQTTQAPEDIPLEMKALYQHEVSALLKELSFFSRVRQQNGTLAGDALLKEAIKVKKENTSDVLEWILEELHSILSLQAGAINGIPEYASQAIRELMERCNEKLHVALPMSIEQIREEIERKRDDGIYRAEAELMLLTQDIGTILGDTMAGADAESLAIQLEWEDYTRQRAQLAPEVQQARTRLGTIGEIDLPQDMSGMLASLSTSIMH